MVYRFSRCQIVPLPGEQVAFYVDGSERLRWHASPLAPRPFFYPLIGPSGTPLTRMGHPGAPNHDHHRSIWFAHNKVLGIDFWSDSTPARIRQKQWLAYQDGDEEAVMGVLLGWFDGHDPAELLEQELFAAVRPGPNGETFVELQSTFRPKADALEFGKTNFGFLAVRVAKSLSAHFGGGDLTDSAGRVGEPAIFGQRAKWMDYSGPVAIAAEGASNKEAAVNPDSAAGGDANRGQTIEGIAYFDHPANPGHPAHWHVREDGWMGASVCMQESVVTTQKQPLVLRYLLHAHRGPLDPANATRSAAAFAALPAFAVRRATVKHQQFEIHRI
jgi:hypothetical protein